MFCQGVEAKDYRLRLALNLEIELIRSHEYMRLAIDSASAKKFGHHGLVQVGRGAVVSPHCAEWRSVKVCEHVENHSVVYQGVDFTDKFVVSHYHWFCHSPLCPKCFLRGYTVRQAQAIEAKLSVGVERGFGDVEHIVVSAPESDYGLDWSVLRRKAKIVELDREVLGACLIPHAFRKVNGMLRFRPHFHSLGFVNGGFDACRNCVHTKADCSECENFKGRQVRGFAKDGWIVKVESKRKSVVGTAHYLLTHATVKVGLKRTHVVSWFGVLGNNRGVKSRKVKAVAVCPICKISGVDSEMAPKRFLGKEFIAKDIGDPDYRRVFPMEEFDPSGMPNFVGREEGG